jgi:hypothetical protein
MSSPQVLLQASQAIADMLKADLPGVEVSLGPPADTPPANGDLLWWLYEVRESEFLRNRPSQLLPARQQATRPPSLGLELYFLLTAYKGSTEDELVALGRAMQVLHDNPVLLVQNQDGDLAEELRISILPQELEERVRVWEALKVAYRLSVAYVVRSVRIDPQRMDADVPVRTVQLGGGE